MRRVSAERAKRKRRVKFVACRPALKELFRAEVVGELDPWKPISDEIGGPDRKCPDASDFGVEKVFDLFKRVFDVCS
jgi:hypothetical protein